MDRVDHYAIVVQTDDQRLIPIISGNANKLAIYKLVLAMSELRQLVPQLLLVVNSHLVQSVDVSAEGMSLQGYTLEELGYGN